MEVNCTSKGMKRTSAVQVWTRPFLFGESHLVPFQAHLKFRGMPADGTGTEFYPPTPTSTGPVLCTVSTSSQHFLRLWKVTTWWDSVKRFHDRRSWVLISSPIPRCGDPGACREVCGAITTGCDMLWLLENAENATEVSCAPGAGCAMVDENRHLTDRGSAGSGFLLWDDAGRGKATPGTLPCHLYCVVPILNYLPHWTYLNMGCGLLLDVPSLPNARSLCSVRGRWSPIFIRQALTIYSMMIFDDIWSIGGISPLHLKYACGIVIVLVLVIVIFSDDISLSFWSFLSHGATPWLIIHF